MGTADFLERRGVEKKIDMILAFVLATLTSPRLYCVRKQESSKCTYLRHTSGETAGTYRQRLARGVFRKIPPLTIYISPQASVDKSRKNEIHFT